jgi:hypothetical protein
LGGPDGIEGITSALALIVLGVLTFIVVIRRRPTPERLGFATLTVASPRATAIAERLFAEPPRSVFHTRAANRDLYLMFVEAGSSETPDFVVGFTDIGTALETGDMALLHSERRIPKFLRRLHGALFKWAQPVDPATASLRPGTGWFWYAAEDGPIQDTPVARALVQASQDRGSKKLLGLAMLRSHLIVWASLPHIVEVVSSLEKISRDERASVEDHGP